MATSIENLTGIRKEQGIAGYFTSRLTLVEFSVRLDPNDPTYQQWARDLRVDPADGGIITSINNLDLLKRRFSSLSAQLREFAGTQEKAPNAKTTLPDNLRAVLKAAAENTTSDSEPLRLLVVTSLQKIPHFEIRETFPYLKVHTTVAAPDADYAQSCNAEIRIIKPDVSGELVYKSIWQDGPYDLVAFNPAIHYADEDGLAEYIDIAANAGAKHVVFSDLLPNRDAGGLSHWQIQPYSGGIIPIRMLGQGELERRMQEAGYKLVAKSDGPISYPVDGRSGIPKQYPSVPNYTFERT